MINVRQFCLKMTQTMMLENTLQKQKLVFQQVANKKTLLVTNDG